MEKQQLAINKFEDELSGNKITDKICFDLNTNNYEIERTITYKPVTKTIIIKGRI